MGKHIEACNLLTEACKVSNIFASHFLDQTKMISQNHTFYYQHKFPNLLDHFICV